MIITKNWLNEFIDLSDISTEKLVNDFNSTGLEVASVRKICLVDEIVLAKILRVSKIENTDKLHTCLLDLGKEQIEVVCGAANVRVGAFVALAKIGAKVGDIKIKATKLRGILSSGMLCSARELGLAPTEEGIMILDESIGELKLGKSLNQTSLFNDEIIELELTPNRGDLLSIEGIAREIGALHDKELINQKELFKASENHGIGRLIGLRSVNEVQSALSFIALQKDENINKLAFKIRFRLALLEKLSKDYLKNLLNYSSHVSGVVLCAYDFTKLCKNCKLNDKIMLDIIKEEDEEVSVYYNGSLINTAGIYQNKEYEVDESSSIIIIQASFTKPKILAKASSKYKEKDDIFYRSSRGSEPKLEKGLAFLQNLLAANKNFAIFSGMQQIRPEVEYKMLHLNLTRIEEIIGISIDKNEALRILRALGFDIHILNDEQITLRIPNFRQDIENIYDICEELVRMIGIDNIKKIPLNFIEKNRENEALHSYRYLKKLRIKACNLGYYESIHYIMDNEEELKELGYNCLNKKLLNPISNELSVLRPTLINHLLKASSNNLKNFKKRVKLFTHGAIFDENLKEQNALAFIYTGFKEEAKISNKAKPSLIDFFTILEELKNIIGEFELRVSKISYLSPFEQASIYINDEFLGFIGRLHLNIEKKYELNKSYICELNLNKMKDDIKLAKKYSIYPSISRDLSILAPINYDYQKIKNCIYALKIELLKELRLIDLFYDDKLKDKHSITINLIFGDDNRTLLDEEVSSCIQEIIKALKTRLDLDLR